MRFSGMVLLFLFLVIFPGAIPAQDQSQPQQEPLSLGEIARRYQQKKQAATPLQSQPATGALKAASNSATDLDLYEVQVKQLFRQKSFAELEKLADQARHTKERFAGGTWKLYGFYEALTTPSSPGAPTTADWSAFFATLREWMAGNPESITAPVALARAYIGYASEARGGGFANTVSEEGWRLEAERTEQARMILMQAARLKERCPYWYEAMQIVALTEGWPKSQAKALFDEAVAFEPDYYHYYREYTSFLLPKWYGEDGEAEEFANEVAGRIAGEQGDFLYFEMSSVINCQCGHDEVHMVNLSWPRIKQGYAALQKLYGSSNLKDNRFAYMAFLAKDKPVAQQLFMKIGDAWNPLAWRNRQYFEAVRAWALNR